MNNLNFLIKRLRRFAFLLFLIPTIGLLGSLFFNNILVTLNYTFHSYEEGNRYPLKMLCNIENNYCMAVKTVKANKLNDCPKYIIEDDDISINGKKINLNDYTSKYFFYDNGRYYLKEDFKKFFLDAKIEKKFYETSDINLSCIKNWKSYSIYKKIPFFFDFLSSLKLNPKYTAGTSEVVYPFLYGESSISNIVKRFPVNFFFKPLLYISSIFMLLYWLYYQRIFNFVKDENKITKFFIFGILSSIFLFLHVFLLGTPTENILLTKIRRIIIVLFIFCELAAQFFLAKRIYISRELIASLTFRTIIYLKIIFVSAIIIISLLIIIILTTYDLSSRVDYFLEWNYFLILLLFYLLSSIMWKLPSTHR